jgi:hypothetical protein
MCYFRMVVREGLLDMMTVVQRPEKSEGIIGI